MNWGCIGALAFCIAIWAAVFYVALLQLTGG